MKKYQWFAIVLAAVSSNVLAEVESTDSSEGYAVITRLEDVVVTSSRQPRYLKEVPVRTEVVTRAELEQNHAVTLEDALRYVPGVMLREIHGKPGSGIWLQGFDSNRVLVLIDGNPVSASTGSSVDITQIAVGDVERIEIIKGAASALYGTSAMGGVVNIITREPQEGVHADIDLSGGSWQEQNLGDDLPARKVGKVALSAKRDQWAGELNVQLDDSSGWKATDEREETQGAKGVRQTVSAKLQYELTPNLQLSLMPRYYHEDLLNVLDNYVPGVGNLPKDKVELTDTYHLAAVLATKGQGDSDWKIRLMGEDYRNESRQDVQATTYIDQKRDTHIQNYEAAVQYDRSWRENHHLTFGVEVKRQSMDVVQDDSLQEVDNKNAVSDEWFLQDSWFATENLELLPGIRIHHDADFGTHISPMLSALQSWEFTRLGRFNLRASIGNGYRVPNLKERYYVFDHSHLGYMVLGNADLKPESSISYQFGGEWYFSDQGSLQFHLYYNDAKDLIESALSPADSTDELAIYRYKNFERVSTRGAELAFNRELMPGVRLNAGYTWLKALDGITGKEMVKRPQHEVKIGLDLQLPAAAQIGVRWRYESEQYLDEDNLTTSPAFDVWDVKFNQKLNDRWAWYAGVDNVTDIQRRFDGNDFRPEEGRYLYAGIRWHYAAP
ncbi:TonB-dependent receptor plug domain-containing protein [Thiomicrorhabdus heinhorstiae]|uniref:TonB-dependent receptor n=1 Tax=Thiomicrorhabdus heinhorstiae TaxID=2748010 RepID=A0ABS0BYJ5_9GAMM|nr:TonB-dependent receptor [Thiomicrorhabdus heinhorstiae]MBF6058130.1 TonB-dependent receptor [Thiomicrorhabdus heinhorstiae]